MKLVRKDLRYDEMFRASLENLTVRHYTRELFTAVWHTFDRNRLDEIQSSIISNTLESIE